MTPTQIRRLVEQEARNGGLRDEVGSRYPEVIQRGTHPENHIPDLMDEPQVDSSLSRVVLYFPSISTVIGKKSGNNLVERTNG